MKRSADVAFLQDEALNTSSLGLPHFQTTPTASPIPASRSPHTRTISRKPSKGSTTLRRGPTFLDRAEQAKAAAAAHWILSRSSSMSHSAHMSDFDGSSSLHHDSSASEHTQPVAATVVVPPAVTKAKQRSNVIRRAKLFVPEDQPHEETVPVPRPAKRQKTSAPNDSESNQNVFIPPILLDAIEIPSTAQVVNGPSYSQSFLAAGYRLMESIGLAGWISPPVGAASPPAPQPETSVDLPHLARLDTDVEMQEAEVKATVNDQTSLSIPQLWPSAPSVPSSAPTLGKPRATAQLRTSTTPYTQPQWKRLSRFPHLLANRTTEPAIRKRVVRKKWEENGYKPSDNVMCHLVRPMMRSPLSSEVFPEEERSSGLLTSHSSMTSLASTVSFEELTSVPSIKPIVWDDKVIPSFSASMGMERTVLYGEATSLQSRYPFYPVFTNKKPGKENRDVLRKTTLLTNFGYWLYQTELWTPTFCGGLKAVMEWFDRFPDLELPSTTFIETYGDVEMLW